MMSWAEIITGIIVLYSRLNAKQNLNYFENTAFQFCNALEM